MRGRLTSITPRRDGLDLSRLSSEVRWSRIADWNASVANRTAEIGSLRALGFRRGAILVAFLLEAVALAILGWAVGLAAAMLMTLVRISTMNWQSFAELAFSFTLTPGIVAQSLVFALAMGFAGGVLPALRAARLKIVDALRAA